MNNCGEFAWQSQAKPYLNYKSKLRASVVKNVESIGRDVVLNAKRLNNSFVKMQIRASKLARKHFYSLLHPTDSNARLERDVVILSLATQWQRRQEPLGFTDDLSKALFKINTFKSF